MGGETDAQLLLLLRLPSSSGGEVERGAVWGGKERGGEKKKGTQLPRKALSENLSFSGGKGFEKERAGSQVKRRKKEESLCPFFSFSLKKENRRVWKEGKKKKKKKIWAIGA